MEIPVERWASALVHRKSTRTFAPTALGQDELRDLTRVADMMRAQCPAARAEVIEHAPAGVFQGIVGSYGAVQGAPACVAFVADTSHPHHQAMTGYLGEAVILEATVHGLATCWVGGFFRSAVIKSLVQIAENERILAVSPLGYAAPTRWDEKIMKRIARSTSRKSIDAICTTAVKSLPAWAQAGLAAARVAPSAVNRQPWMFSHADGVISVSAVKGPEPGSVSRRLDCGIAMLHFTVGATTAGMPGHWEWRSGAEVGVYRARK